MSETTTTPEMLAWLESHLEQTAYVQGVLDFQQQFNLTTEDAIEIVDRWTVER